MDLHRRTTSLPEAQRNIGIPNFFGYQRQTVLKHLYHSLFAALLQRRKLRE